MRSHGVPNFPDPSPGGGLYLPAGLDPNTSTFQHALTACQKYRSAGGGIPTGAQLSYDMAHLLRYAQCMRAHGVTNFPDPTITPGGGPGFKFSQYIDQNSPTFQSADKACHHLLPNGGEGDGT